MTCEQGHDFTDPVVTRAEGRNWRPMHRTNWVMEKAVVFCRRCGRAIAFGWEAKDDEEDGTE